QKLSEQHFFVGEQHFSLNLHPRFSENSMSTLTMTNVFGGFMKLNQSLASFITFAALVNILSGCSSLIVRKPEINGVKTVALVTVYADDMVPWTGGQGRVENFDTKTKNRVAL